MMASGMEPLPFFPLRALLEYENAYQIYVGRCLETGSVVTADDIDTVRKMLKEVLEDEIDFAIEHGNFANLFSTPAPIEYWVKWQNLAATQKPERMELNITATAIKLDGDAEVSSEVRVVKARAA